MDCLGVKYLFLVHISVLQLFFTDSQVEIYYYFIANAQDLLVGQILIFGAVLGLISNAKNQGQSFFVHLQYM